MSDIYCVKCGEPCELDYLHEVAEERHSTFLDVLADFRQNGCTALGFTHNEADESVDKTFGLTHQEASSVLFDLLGDDVDGVAAMMEDMNYGW